MYTNVLLWDQLESPTTFEYIIKLVTYTKLSTIMLINYKKN